LLAELSVLTESLFAIAVHGVFDDDAMVNTESAHYIRGKALRWKIVQEVALIKSRLHDTRKANEHETHKDKWTDLWFDFITHLAQLSEGAAPSCIAEATRTATAIQFIEPVLTDNKEEEMQQDS
jgi:hypothetical protein